MVLSHREQLAKVGEDLCIASRRNDDVLHLCFLAEERMIRRKSQLVFLIGDLLGDSSRPHQRISQDSDRHTPMELIGLAVALPKNNTSNTNKTECQADVINEQRGYDRSTCLVADKHSWMTRAVARWCESQQLWFPVAICGELGFFEFSGCGRTEQLVQDRLHTWI